MKVGVFHPGTQHSWQTAIALQQLDRLAWYATSIFHKPDSFPYNLEKVMPGPVARRMNREFRRFSHPLLDPAQVRTSGAWEWLERMAARAHWPRVAKYLDQVGNRQFARGLAKDIGSADPFALWGYSASSLSAFELGKAAGRRLILDRTIGDDRAHQAVLAGVAERFPEWCPPLRHMFDQSQIDTAQREYELADVILAGSAFSAQTVRDHAGPECAAKLRVLHYCYDDTLFGNLPAPQLVSKDEPVRFLYVGLVNPRKGFHHLIEAFCRLPKGVATLTVVGGIRVPHDTFARYADRITYIPAAPRAEIPRIMADHHALVFPSYFEGAGIVLYEALAAGCALIQSDRCARAATDDTGITLDQLDTDSVLAAMEALILDRDRLNFMRSNAQAEAQKYTFASYRDNIGTLLTDMAI